MYNVVMEQPATIIISHIVFIIIVFWAMQAIHYEKFIRKNRVIQARLLFSILAIVIGYLLSSFFLEYLAAFKSIFQMM